MSKILYLEKRGCDFFDDDTRVAKSDVGNYRVGIYDYSIKGKDGKNYTLEFSRCTMYNYRKHHKRTGKPLKHTVKELINQCGLNLNTSYEKYENGEYKGTYRNCPLESKYFQQHLDYTLDNILKVVNDISIDVYDKIEFKKEEKR